MGRYIDNEYTQPQLRRTGFAVARAPATRRRAAVGSVRRFSYVLLATLLSTLVVVADRMVDAWTSGGLVLALAVLWLVIFGGLVLFGRVSGRLALWLAGAWQDVVARPDRPNPERQPG